MHECMGLVFVWTCLHVYTFEVINNYSHKIKPYQLVKQAISDAPIIG